MPRYRLSEPAEDDIVRLLDYTWEQYGEAAKDRYEALIARAILDVAAAPDGPLTRPQPEIGAGIHTYHLRHSRDRARTKSGLVQSPRHFLLYRFGGDVVGIGRVLHDAMNITLHLPLDYGDED